MTFSDIQLRKLVDGNIQTCHRIDLSESNIIIGLGKVYNLWNVTLFGASDSRTARCWKC